MAFFLDLRVVVLQLGSELLLASVELLAGDVQIGVQGHRVRFRRAVDAVPHHAVVGGLLVVTLLRFCSTSQVEYVLDDVLHLPESRLDLVFLLDGVVVLSQRSLVSASKLVQLVLEAVLVLLQAFILLQALAELFLLAPDLLVEPFDDFPALAHLLLDGLSHPGLLLVLHLVVFDDILPLQLLQGLGVVQVGREGFNQFPVARDHVPELGDLLSPALQLVMQLVLPREEGVDLVLVVEAQHLQALNLGTSHFEVLAAQL